MTILEKDVARLDNILEKMDASVEKLTEISANVSKILAVHDNRLDHQDKMFDQLSVLIDKNKESSDGTFKDIRKDIESTKNELLTKINENTTKISDVQKWMWTGMGAISAVLLIADKLGPLLGLG